MIPAVLIGVSNADVTMSAGVLSMAISYLNIQRIQPHPRSLTLPARQGK
jgi:hypothetical protein